MLQSGLPFQHLFMQWEDQLRKAQFTLWKKTFLFSNLVPFHAQRYLWMVASSVSAFRILCIMISSKETMQSSSLSMCIGHYLKMVTQYMDFAFPIENSIRPAYSTNFLLFLVDGLSINSQEIKWKQPPEDSKYVTSPFKIMNSAEKLHTCPCFE